MSWLTSTTLPDPDGASGSSFFGTNLAAPVMQSGYDANGNLRTQDAPGLKGRKQDFTYDETASQGTDRHLEKHPGGPP